MIASPTRTEDKQQLSEMLEIIDVGAVAFGTGLQSIDDANLLLRILQYLKSSDRYFIHIPSYPALIPESQVHESPTNIYLGIKAMPDIEELMRIQRDILLAQYTDGKLMIQAISSSSSLKAVKNAKRNSPSLKCSVSAMHISYIDEDLSGFDSNLKLIPPLRSEADSKSTKKRRIGRDGGLHCQPAFSARRRAERYRIWQCRIRSCLLGPSISP